MAWLPEEWKKMIISVEEIQTQEDGKTEYVPVGTAFLVDYNGFNVLVTCKHILNSADLNKLFLSFNTQDHQIHRIPFNTLSNNLINWVIDTRPEIDIAIILLPLDFDKWDIRKLPLNMFSSYEELYEGDELFFLGFPLGIKSLSGIHPLVRQGIIAFKHEGGPFLIDAHVYPGNSGSPVFLKPSVIDFDAKGNVTVGNVKPPKLIGIISSYIPYVDPCISVQTNRARITFEENSGLAEVFPVDLIMNLIQSQFFQKMLEGADPEKKWGDKEPLKNSGTEKKFNPSNLTNVRLFKK
jgi:hypothetical protein